MSAPSAVSVDDDLATRETGVTLRAADDEETGRLDLGTIMVSTQAKQTGDLQYSRGKWSCRRDTWRG